MNMLIGAGMGLRMYICSSKLKPLNVHAGQPQSLFTWSTTALRALTSH